MSQSCEILTGKEWRIQWSHGYFEEVDRVRFTRSTGKEEAYDILWSDGVNTYKLADVACHHGMLSERCEAFKESSQGWTPVGVYDVYVEIEPAASRVHGLCELVAGQVAGQMLKGIGTEDPLAGSWAAEARGTGPSTS